MAPIAFSAENYIQEPGIKGCSWARMHQKKQSYFLCEQRTDLVLDVVGHPGHLVEESQRLVHALLDDTEVGQHLHAHRDAITADSSCCRTLEYRNDRLCPPLTQLARRRRRLFNADRITAATFTLIMQPPVRNLFLSRSC